MADLHHHTRELRRVVSVDDAGVRDAVRTGSGVAVAALVFYALASIWVGTCTGSIADAAGCGAPQRAMLTLGAPGILLAGGLWSLTQTFRVRRDHTAWWVWLGTGWLLLVLMVLSAFVSLPSL